LTQQELATESVQMPVDPAEYGAILYETLHRLDGRHFDWIAVEMPPDWPEWAAIRDRLMRASGTSTPDNWPDPARR
jgi:hypothetical protein